MLDAADPRSSDPRDRDPDRARAGETIDPREVFANGLNLPSGREREHVYVDDNIYQLRGSEVRALATIGAFRVVSARDLSDDDGRAGDLRHGDLEHLHAQGLIERVVPVARDGLDSPVALTDRGREVLERHRDPERHVGQRYYAGPAKTRELSHDAQLFRAYLQSAERLRAQGARIDRVVLENDLKRAYQAFLQDGNRDRSDSDGRPTRAADEIAEWARAHHLPVVDDGVLFPDFRMEYEWPDGRRDVEDVEVLTPHYRGAHAASKAGSGFTCYRVGSGVRVGGSHARTGGRPFDPDAAKAWLR